MDLVNVREWKATRWVAIDGRQLGLSYKHKNGKLISSYTYSNLTKIAWEIGIPDPSGLHHNYIDYVNGWKESSKGILSQHIWNYLQLNHRFITLEIFLSLRISQCNLE